MNPNKKHFNKTDTIYIEQENAENSDIIYTYDITISWRP